MEFLGAISTIIKELKDIILSYRLFIIAFFIGLLGTLLLTLPDNLLETFYVKELRDNQTEVIGAIAFVCLFIAFCGLAYYVGVWLFGLGKGKYQARKRGESEIEVLKQLTPVECKYLANYIFKQTQTAYFSPSDGVVGGLESKGILYRSSNLGRVHNFAYNIQPWAYEQLSKNPQLLTTKLAGSEDFKELLDS